MMQFLKNTFLRYISILMIFVSVNQNIAKADGITDVVNVIMSLTCETEGIGDLLTKPFTHTCIQDAFSTMYVAAIVSPGLYPAMMLRLRIDDDNIFPDNCMRKNRANPSNPTLSFGLCSNIKMIVYRAEMIAQFAVSLIGGSPSWDSLSNMLDSSNYTELFHDKHDGDWGLFADLPLDPTGMSFAPVFPWKVLVHGDRICVETISFIGWMHVGCKYIAEPFPKSIYGSFFNDEDYDIKNPDGTLKYATYQNARIPMEMADYLDCTTSGGCAYRAMAASHAPISISATIMQCIKEMLTKLLISKQVCNIGSVRVGDNINRADSVFYQFQVNMQRTVMAMLTLYVMFIGFKILLAGEELPKTGEMIMYILKIILVIYFSVGINVNGSGSRFDGMTGLIFPLLMGAASEIAIWVMNATPSGLCRFLPSDYPAGLGYIALWDALDCKVIHYLGIDAIMTFAQGQHSGDPLGNSIPPYVFLLIPALYFKQVNLIILAITYPLVVISLAAFLVNSFAVCMIAIAILGILAPIYVPMALFEQTKGYFEGWYTLMISFVLQPVVVIGFMTLMFALYDMGFYGTCKYKEMVMKVRDANGEVRTKKLFIIDDVKAHYVPEASYSDCQQSIGYILNNPIGSMAANIARNSQDGKTIDMSSAPEEEKTFADYLGQFSMLSGIVRVGGFFFTYFSLLSQLSWSMIVNLMTCCLLLYLMYELSSQLGEFASDIAQSVTLSGVISPRGLSDKVIGAIKLADKARQGGIGGGGAPSPSMGTGSAPAPSMATRGVAPAPTMGEKAGGAEGGGLVPKSGGTAAGGGPVTSGGGGEAAPKIDSSGRGSTPTPKVDSDAGGSSDGGKRDSISDTVTSKAPTDKSSKEGESSNDTSTASKDGSDQNPPSLSPKTTSTSRGEVGDSGTSTGDKSKEDITYAALDHSAMKHGVDGSGKIIGTKGSETIYSDVKSLKDSVLKGESNYATLDHSAMKKGSDGSGSIKGTKPEESNYASIDHEATKARKNIVPQQERAGTGSSEVDKKIGSGKGVSLKGSSGGGSSGGESEA